MPAVPSDLLRHAGRRVDVDLSAVIAHPEALSRALAAAAADLRPGQLLVYHCGPQNPPPSLRKAAAEIARQLGFPLRGWPEAPARVAGRNWSYALECPAGAAKDFAGSRR